MAFNAVDDLTKLCRICLGEGEFNLLEHVVQLPPDDGELVINELEEKVSAHEMLSVFSKHPFTELYRNAAAAQLICHFCLDELIPSFLFSRKVEKADKRLASFLENIVTDTLLGDDNETFIYLDEEESDEIIKEEFLVTFENEESSPFIDSTPNLNTVSEETSNQALQEEVIQVQDAQTFTRVHDQKRRKMSQNPRFVQTDGVSQLLTRVNHTATDAPTSQKRLKKRDREKLELEQGSFVVTQFIPSMAQIESLHNPIEGDDQTTEADNPMAGKELRTMDYAAVEIEAHGNELHIDENDTITSAGTITGEHGEHPQAVYVCKYCPQAFSAANFLMTHVRKRHVCKYCTQPFSKSSDLYEHIRSTHTVHKCAICGKEMSTHSNLRSHIKRMHGLKLPAQVALLDYLPRTSVNVQNTQQSEEDIPQVEEEERYECIEVDESFPPLQDEEEFITAE